MSGSNPLTITRDPTVLVNPLAAITAGTQAAGHVMDVQSKQGEQLVGQALQQATDENGVLDTQKAMRIAAGMGPNAAFAMQGFLKTSSGLRGAQIEQGGKLDDLVTTLSASAISDPSDANMASIRARMVAAGAPPSMTAEVDRIAAIRDPAQRRIEAWKHLSGRMGAEYNLAAGGFGTPALTTLGGTTSPTVTTPATPFHPGGVSFGAGVAHTQDPATYYAPQSTTIWYDANGQVTTDPSKVARTETRDIPRGPAMGAPSPGSVGGPQGGGPGAATQPGDLPPNAPPPLPGQRLVLKNGQFVPAPPVVAPRPVVPGVVTSSPQGQPDLLAKDNEVRTQANLAMEDQQKRLIAGNSALEALKLASTGPGTATTSRIYSFLQAQSPGGATPQGTLSDTAWRQVLVKNLLRFAQSSSPRASTDQQLSTQIESNPNPEQLAPAIHHILVQDMGVLKRSIAQTQEMPASGPAGSVVKHVGEFSANTASEAFMWNHYTPEERAAIEAQYAKDGKTKQLHDSLELAVRRGAIPDPRKAPAVPPAVVAPPPPAPNHLVPTN